MKPLGLFQLTIFDEDGNKQQFDCGINLTIQETGGATCFAYKDTKEAKVENPKEFYPKIAMLYLYNNKKTGVNYLRQLEIIGKWKLEYDAYNGGGGLYLSCEEVEDINESKL